MQMKKREIQKTVDYSDNTRSSIGYELPSEFFYVLTHRSDLSPPP